jgi:hypothetical protein
MNQANAILTRKDLFIGTGFALLMLLVFIKISSGLSLIVTFVPGLAFTYALYACIYAKRIPIPAEGMLAPLYFITLAIQFLHFMEEFSTGFQAQFPQLYSGGAYTNELFVSINMVSYFIFTLSAVLVFYKQIHFLLFPMLFFIVYGAMGNAIAHTFWSTDLHSYFPGLFTAQIYWILGPLALSKFIQDKKQLIGFIVVFALVLCYLLGNFATTGYPF